jgi:hypothetical protein
VRAFAAALLALGCSSGPADLAPCSVRCGAGGMCPDEALCFPDGFCHRAGDPSACGVDAVGAADAALPPDGEPDASPPDGEPDAEPDGSPPDAEDGRDGPPPDAEDGRDGLFIPDGPSSG